MGEAPAARWRHTATVFDDTKLLIFGGFHSSKERLNDLWMLDTSSMEWSQPANVSGGRGRSRGGRKSGARDGGGAAGDAAKIGRAVGTKDYLDEFGEIVGHGASQFNTDDPDVPTPRGAHSAVLVDRRVVVFGGYGGVEFQRVDFNDSYALDVDSMVWSKLEGISGEPPAPRSGHGAAAVKSTMLVFGGWNVTDKFNDLWSLDMETMAWSHVEGAEYSVPRWNHAALSVSAVPSWQVFLFGGAAMDEEDEDATPAQGLYRNDLAVMDTGAMKWLTLSSNARYDEGEGAGEERKEPEFDPTAVEATGLPPLPRAEPSMAYNPEDKSLVIFGGWANGWQNDLHVMSVGCIIGPPYAIRSVEPVLGPVTGATKLTIKGLGFEPGTTALVKFQIGRKTAESTGQCVDETTIEVDSPNVEAIGPGKAVVRLSMRGHPPTITHASFEYFDVTDPGKSLAFGPGVIDGVSAGYPAEFYIQARDTANLERRTGHDEFVVTVTRVVEGEAGDGEEPETVEAHIHDEENGRYLVKYTAPAPGTYDVAVAFNGTFGAEAGPIRGTPFRVTAVEGDAKNNVFAGGRTLEATKSSVKSVGQFAKKTLEGVTATVGDEDLDGLLSIKKHLVAVAQQDAKTQLDIDTANAMLAHLQRTAPKGGNRDADKLVKQLEGHTGTWEEAKKAAPITKASIAPHEKRYTAVTSNELDEYQEQVKRWVMDEGRREFWLFETGHDPAITKLNTARVEFADAKAVLRHKTFLANMFELDDMVKGPQAAFEEVAGEMEQVEALWAVEEECRTYFESCKEGLFSEVDADQMEEDVKKLHKKLKAGVSKRVRTTGVYRGTDQLIKDFLTTVPLIAALTHKSMRPRHWSALMKATNKTFTPPYEDASMKLRALLDLNLHEFAADVEEITDQALKEEKMEQGLEKLKEVWKGADGDAAAGVQFLGEPYKEGSDIMVLKIGEEDFEMLENDQLTVQGMAASRYVAYFEEVVGVWQKELGMVADTLVLLTDIQRTWSYLEPLFIHSEEVKRELPEDAERFAGIDTNVKRILKEAWGVRNVINACNRDGLYGELEGIGEELEVCKKSLADYLDSKRQQFPRFYFVSEADLLDILSNGNTPSKVVAHITKVFLATSTLELDESGGGRPTATKFVSAVGVEEVDFEPAIKLDGKVEIYLQTLLDGQVESLRKRMVRSIARYPTKARTEWLLDRDSSDRAEDPAAVSVLVAGMDYVKTVESTFRSIAGGDEDAMKTTHERIIQDLSDLIRLTQTKLTKPDRRRVMTMITLDAHGRDIVGKMIREGVKEEKSFQWQSQLKQRYADEHARVCILDSTFDYGYEYLGNGARLVITPLTDRIYVTATQALNLKMGCAPAGPAGTGKTETTKDLASALGKCCYVFNCSPEMDYKSMGNIFKGLAASGSWGCFDEFNRLIPEVLSVCSVQFKAVCDSIRLDRDVVTIEGDTVHCDHTAGVFITMNPGYLGRSELPEGLKSLFRPITVMVPDLVLICENMLMAEGFVEAKTLASKFYGLYSLLRELLSKQTHYDWGLRAVKSVLVVAGGFKRAEPDLPEQDLLMRALRDFNTPKIVAQDEVVFFGLLHDLFPGIDPPRKTDPDLEQAVKTATVERGLHPDEFFMLKVVQLEELLEIRHCVFVMGPPGSGKSQCWRTLAGARGVLGNKTKTIDLNPKSVSPSELYGYITMATREWRDGLLSKIMRDLGQEPNTKPKWIILDGDLDANWIESMNSVMDDNKMLTLASNERIPLKAHMRMLFEIRDLAFATPATVSRAGIIYISTNLGSQWRSIIASWVASNPESTPEQKEFTASLFEKYAPDTLLFIKKECRPLVPVEDVTMITNLTRMMDVLLTEEMWKSLAGKGEEEWKHVVETYFVYCAVWAFGSALSVRDGEDYRVRFSEFWRGEFKTVRLPGRETVFDYWLDPEELHFEPWKQSPHFETIEYDSKLTPMNAVTVPTPETCSVTFWMSLLVNSHKPIMLVGYAGCGKTQLVKGLLDSQDPEVRMSTAINFNFYTSAQALQVNLEAPLEKKTGTNFGPPGKKQLIFFVDDLNLPEVDPYNTQSAIALVRQHIDYGHWYDRAKLMVKNVDKCQYIAAMNPTAGSFLVNPRLQRHFVTFAIGFPGPTSLHTIYNTFLSGHLKHFSEDIQALDGAIVNAALGLHAAVAGAFRKSAVNFHYEFNIRHMSNVFQGLLMAGESEFTTPEKVAMLWLHESERVYGDRLVSYEDLAKYKTLAQNQVKKRFPQFNLSGFFAAENADPLIFAHFADNIQDKVYDRITSMEKLRTTLEDALREYNESNATMDLVLFEDAMRHVCRISRIINNPAGHALLVGVGGSGK
jgi:dynein heavy chain